MNITASGCEPSAAVTEFELVPKGRVAQLEEEKEELACEAGEALHALETAKQAASLCDLERDEAARRCEALLVHIAPFEEMARALIAVRSEADDAECIRRTPTGADTNHALTIGHCRALVAAIDRMRTKEPAPAESP